MSKWPLLVIMLTAPESKEAFFSPVYLLLINTLLSLYMVYIITKLNCSSLKRYHNCNDYMVLDLTTLMSHKLNNNKYTGLKKVSLIFVSSLFEVCSSNDFMFFQGGNLYVSHH